MDKIIGRENEIALLQRMTDSPNSEFLAVYGRRRIGKTFLIRKYYTKQISFQMTGALKASTSDHLNIFYSAIKNVAEEPDIYSVPENWFDAFEILKNYIQTLKEGKKVIFFDELPWIDTPRSKFLTALEHFWNSWASDRSDIILIVCGSAASWIIRKIINNHGGLYNRVTQRLHLLPFTLKETEEFLKAKKIILDRYQILQIYMVCGGVPFYLNQFVPGRSSFQEIDRLAFTKNGFLATEYNNLYHSIFNNPDKHIAIIEALASKPQGLTRVGLLKVLKIKDGGSISRILTELEDSGFINLGYPFNNKIKNAVYRIIDQYSLFYLKFIRQNQWSGPGSWLSRLDSPAWRAWSGYAYESICFEHLSQIKKALGISGVFTETSSWIDVANSVQIDLLINRRDHIINICEIKFTQEQFTLTKAIKENIEKKVNAFKEETRVSKTIFPTLITTFGLKENIHSIGFIQNVITMDDLFQ